MYSTHPSITQKFQIRPGFTSINSWTGHVSYSSSHSGFNSSGQKYSSQLDQRELVQALAIIRSIPSSSFVSFTEFDSLSTHQNHLVVENGTELDSYLPCDKWGL